MTRDSAKLARGTSPRALGRLVTVGLAAVAMTVAACGTSAPSASQLAASASAEPASSAASPTPASSSAPTANLQLWHDKGSWQDWFVATGDALKADTGLTWEPVPYSDSDAYRAAIKTSAGSSSTADLFTWWTGTLLKDVTDPGLVEDVSPLWEAESAGFSDGLKALFSVDGKAYGAPLFIAPWVIYYNKDVFEQNGLTVPTTWDEFLAVCEKLKAAGVTPLGASTDWATMYFQTLLVHSDPQLWRDIMSGAKPWTDPGALEVMQLWESLISKGYFTDPSTVHYGGPNGNNFANLFADGKVGMTAMATWYGPTMAEANVQPDEDYGAFILPSVKPDAEKAIVVEAAPLSVAANGQQKEAAIDALKWFMSKDGYTSWVDASGLTSARSDVPSKSETDNQVIGDIQDGGYAAVDRIFEATPLEIAQTANDEFGKFMLQGGDPAATLAAIQAKAAAVFGS